jgi:hypothetical protein
MNRSIVCILIVIFAGCSGNSHETTGSIIQRRETVPGRIMLTYQFMAGGQLFTDSMEVENRILPHDSVRVLLPSGDAKHAQLRLP